MKILSSLAKRLGYISRKEVLAMMAQRKYDGAVVGRLTADWTTAQLSADSEIFRDYRRCVDRSRDLERNDDYMRSFLRCLVNNVIGHAGIGLQMKVPGFVQADGKKTLDKYANSVIEEGWYEWCQKQNCTVTGEDSWEETQAISLRAAARDGNVFVRRLKGYDNDFQFALQLFESDHLDTNYNVILGNGNFVRMGIEMTPYRKRLAYHFWTRNPGDVGMVPGNSLARIRIPASEISHLFIRERIGQTLGMPWGISTIRRLHMLKGYEEAELVAARVGASKMGFLESQTPEDWPGPKEGGRNIQEVEPGMIESLDPGQKFVGWDPSHPNANYGAYTKDCVRGISAGLGEAYHTISGNLEGVNYSSARIGMLESREQYKSVQGWFIRQLVADVFKDWLEMFLLKPDVNLPVAKLAKFNAGATWKPRRWPWTDPEADVKASILGIRAGLTSRRAVIAEGGGDIEEVDQDIEADNESAAEHGLELPELESDQPEEAAAPEANGNGSGNRKPNTNGKARGFLRNLLWRETRRPHVLLQ